MTNAPAPGEGPSFQVSPQSLHLSPEHAAAPLSPTEQEAAAAPRTCNWCPETFQVEPGEPATLRIRASARDQAWNVHVVTKHADDLTKAAMQPPAVVVGPQQPQAQQMQAPSQPQPSQGGYAPQPFVQQPPQQPMYGHPQAPYTPPPGTPWVGMTENSQNAAPTFRMDTPQGGGGLSHQNAALFQQPQQPQQQYPQPQQERVPMHHPGLHPSGQTHPLAPHAQPLAPAYATPQGYGQEHAFVGVDGSCVSAPGMRQGAGNVDQLGVQPIIGQGSNVHQAVNGQQVGGGQQAYGRAPVQFRSQNASGGDPTVPVRPVTYAPHMIDPATGRPVGEQQQMTYARALPPGMVPSTPTFQEQPEREAFGEAFSANGDLVPTAVGLLKGALGMLEAGISSDPGERLQAMRLVDGALGLLKAAWR